MEASGGAFSSRLFWSEKSEVFEEVRARVREGGRVPNMDFGQTPVEGGEVEVVRFSLGLLGLGILGGGGKRTKVFGGCRGCRCRRGCPAHNQRFFVRNGCC